MSLVAGLDFGGGAVKACVADVASGEVLALTRQPTETLHPAPGRAEFEPERWWQAASAAMREAVTQVARPGADYVAISSTSLRQGYVLLDEVSELGNGVLNSDRRGEEELGRLRDEVGIERLYRITGHWPAPQLTLPKLLHEQRYAAERWERTQTVLFVHDWSLWRLSGERVSEPSVASSGQLLNVAERTWATDLLDAVGLGSDKLAALVAAGTVAGRLKDGSLGLPLGLPVVAGGGDTQMAAAGAGGLDAGVVSIVAGTTTPIQASSATVPTDPQRHPWVSAHLLADRWAVETNVGYAGMNLDWLARMTDHSVSDLAEEASHSQPGAAGVTALVASAEWSEQAWNDRSPSAVLGFEPRHARGDLARAFIEAHAYAIRANVDDLERAVGTAFRHIDLLGGAGRVRVFAQLVADVIGRPVRQVESLYPPGRAFAWLARRATDSDAATPAFVGDTLDPAMHDAYDEGYRRFRSADEAVSRGLTGWGA